MRIATVAQSREIDEQSQAFFALPGDVLMEAAGAVASREIEQAFFPELKRGLISVVCGPGHNGGDGLVVARHLHSAGYRDLTVFLVAPAKKRSDLFKIQLERVQRQGITVVDGHSEPARLEKLRSSKLVVDALFGIGLNQEVSGHFAKVIELINGCKSSVVSLDIPSGLDGDRGVVLGVAVRATMTITFGLAKPGFFVSDGPSRVGRLRILPIGFPYELLRGLATSHFAFTEKLARRYIPPRPDQSNKTQHGHLLVIAGRPGTWGAGLLAASSAYRMGTGYVTWASYEEPLEMLKDQPEIMTAKINTDSESGVSEFLRLKKLSAVAIGPGLGVSAKTAELIELLKTEGLCRVVLDADALTACVNFDLFPLPPTWVVTPHAGELSRIIDVNAKVIESDRYRYALQGSRKVGCHVLLKGFRSVLAYQKRCMVILAGNAALAKAGTGDVLTGMIGGLLAQGVPPVQAAATAAYIHGRMADEWVRSGQDKRALCASDLREQLPLLMSRLAGGAIV